MEQMDLTIFDLSPIAMWLQDFSGIKKIFDQWTAQGIPDIKQHLLEDTSRLKPCLAAIRTIHINQSTLILYEADDLAEILEKFPKCIQKILNYYISNFFQHFGIKKKIARFKW